MKEQRGLHEHHGAAGANHVPAVEDALHRPAETIFLFEQTDFPRYSR
jgi:hypothetical protein